MRSAVVYSFNAFYNSESIWISTVTGCHIFSMEFLRRTAAGFGSFKVEVLIVA
ncbi:MAG TPA: hypothetical protein VH437_13625 [Terriglobales bacterium]|jgi:hypothetical protein